MPLPLLWVAGAAIAGLAGYAAKKASEDDDSDDYDSSYDDDRRQKADKELRKKLRKLEKESIKLEFSGVGERCKVEINEALRSIVTLSYLEEPAFRLTLSKKNSLASMISDWDLDSSSEPSLAWATKYCEANTLNNLSFLLKTYSVNIEPTKSFQMSIRAVEQYKTDISNLREKREMLMRLKKQLMQS